MGESLMVELLTFDCYGTLIDTAPLRDKLGTIAAQQSIDRSAMIHTYSSFEDRLMYGEGLFTVYSQIFYQALEYCEMELNADHLTDYYEQLIEVHRKLRPFPEVARTLAALKAKGYRTALLSNSDWSLMPYHLKALHHDFDAVYLAEDLHAYKPQIHFFKQVQDQLRTHHHVHIAAGFWWDIVPAQKMNWRRTWVNRRRQKGIRHYMPYTEVKTLGEVLNYL